MILSPVREAYVLHVLGQIGIDYVWGGKSRSGLDCSGSPTLAMFDVSKGKLDWRFTHNTDSLYAAAEPIGEADLLPGDWVLYAKHANGPADVDHLMTYISPELCIGACGGDSNTITNAIAQDKGARVKAKFFYRYRRGELRGYRRLPESLIT